MGKLLETITFTFLALAFVRAYFMLSNKEMSKDVETNLEHGEKELLSMLHKVHAE